LGAPLPAVGSAVQETVTGLRQDLGAAPLADLRLVGLRQLLRDNPKSLETDDHGAPVVRGEVLAISPSPASLQAAQAAGFSIIRRESLDALGLEEVILSPPAGQSARQAVRALRKLDPQGQYDFDHIYSYAGAAPAADAEPGGGPAVERAPQRTRLGLLDTGFSRDDPVFKGSAIEQQAFAPGGIKVDAHGTAVASLMVGQAGRFHGAAPGARLYAADVYGTGPTGGSADAIVHALAWMAREGVPVINVSLVGPPNLTLEAAVRALSAKGALIVAPVGNDGPAAPPLYPASYPGVIAVTAVDRGGRPLVEAGRARHLDFAAPGADMVAERPGGALAPVRGTSFAAPIVAGRLALLLQAPDPAGAARAVAELASQAKRPGGRLGHGLVGEDVRLDPRAAH
jgi:subtilisin family serine protease